MNTVIVVFLLVSLVLFGLGAWRQEKRSHKSAVSSQEVAGFFMWQAIDRWVNYLLYPAMITIFGLVNGTLVMIVVTLFSNTIYVITNNATEGDWTFMSWFTLLRDNGSHLWPLRYCRALKRLPWLRRPLIKSLGLVRALLRVKVGRFSLANPIGYLYLSVWKDSFYAINFLYHKEADLRKPRILGLYLISHIICNMAWAPFAGLISVGVGIALKALPIS